MLLKLWTISLENSKGSPGCTEDVFWILNSISRYKKYSIWQLVLEGCAGTINEPCVFFPITFSSAVLTNSKKECLCNKYNKNSNQL